MSVGIEQIYCYAPQYALPLAALAAARGVALEGLGVQAMAIAPACEDVVTLAATAASRCLRAARVDPREIGMLVVACRAARMAGEANAMITSTFNWTSSAANPGSRSYWPSAKRHSSIRSLPST